MELIFEYINILGSFALAISGALTAMKKRFDGFGIMIVAFVTAVGGGTLRDMLLSERNVFWFEQPYIIYYIFLGTILAVIFKSKIQHLYKPLLLFDAIGLGLFTVIGVQVGINQNLEPIICIILGAITGTFGGVMRDVLVNEIPVIFRKEVYATVSLLGGAVYYMLSKTALPEVWQNIIPIVFIIVMRLVVVFFKISLPSVYKKEAD